MVFSGRKDAFIYFVMFYCGDSWSPGWFGTFSIAKEDLAFPILLSTFCVLGLQVRASRLGF